MKNIVLLVLTVILFSCNNKEKSYEQLESEILCDILPEFVKYELNNEIKRAEVLPLIPPPDLDSLKYTNKQLDSILSDFIILKNKYLERKKTETNTAFRNIDGYKKYEIVVIDTLRDNEKLENDRLELIHDFLESRILNKNNFINCNLKVRLVSYDETFEGDERSTKKAVLFPTRVLIDKEKQHATFTILKMYEPFTVYCSYSKRFKKWVISKVVNDE